MADRRVGAAPNAQEYSEVVLVDKLTGAALAIGGSGSSAGQVQGAGAAGVAAVGNPVGVGGVFNTTPDTLTNGQRGDLQLDPNQNLLTSALYTRPVPITGSFTPGTASYTAGMLIGPTGATAAITVVVDVALANQMVKIARVAINPLAGTINAGVAVIASLAEGGLAGNYADGAVPAFSAADLLKIQHFSTAGGPIYATNALFSAAPAASPTVLLDGAGAFQLLISSSGVFTMTTPGAWSYRVEVMK